MVAAFGMLVAVVATFFKYVDGHALHHVWLILLAMVIGVIVAVPTARFVKMTAMPQLVAIFNGVGGGAAALVSITEFIHIHSTHPATYVTLEVLLGVLIGTLSFAGSAIAFAKLQELMTGSTRHLPGPAADQRVSSAGGALALIVTILVTASTGLLWILFALSFVLGVVFVLPIGGADVPVLISLLERLHRPRGRGLGIHARFEPADRRGNAGRRLGYLAHAPHEQGNGPKPVQRPVLGLRLGRHRQRCDDARRRSQRAIGHTRGHRRSCSASRSRVVIIPGYGLAVAQAQHVLRELAELLESKGIEVFYAIHPVAGRMPGHMNVLLAEANVPYEQLLEMDEANSELATADVALVVGANDTVNPAAIEDPTSPIYGMPIIHADLAENIVFLKRSMRPGFAGIENELLYNPKTTLVFGDAKDTLTKIVAAVKAN